MSINRFEKVHGTFKVWKKVDTKCYYEEKFNIIGTYNVREIGLQGVVRKWATSLLMWVQADAKCSYELRITSIYWHLEG